VSIHTVQSTRAPNLVTRVPMRLVQKIRLKKNYTRSIRARSHEPVTLFGVDVGTCPVTNGHNRQRWTRLILPASGRDTNASISVTSSLVRAHARAGRLR